MCRKYVHFSVQYTFPENYFLSCFVSNVVDQIRYTRLLVHYIYAVFFSSVRVGNNFWDLFFKNFSAKRGLCSAKGCRLFLGRPSIWRKLCSFSKDFRIAIRNCIVHCSVHSWSSCDFSSLLRKTYVQRNNKWRSVKVCSVQKPNSLTYYFADVFGHNLESSQTWGFHVQCLYY